MPLVTIGLGILLMALGIGTYVYTGQEHPTALIPTWVGIPFILLGLLALKETLVKHAMHAAAALGLIVFLGLAAMLIKPVMTLLAGSELERPTAVLSQALMAGLCGIFEILCVRSFIAARRRRTSAELGKPLGA